MSNELLAELSEEELAPPDFYPIEYALMWVAYGNKPINSDYAKIIYDKPPRAISNDKLQNAEKKLMTYLRSGKISAKTSEYEPNDKGKYVRTGKHDFLEREAWKGTFDWFDLTLNYCDSKGVWYECTEIIVNTEELLKCVPIEDSLIKKANDNSSKKTKILHPKEKETLLKIVLGLALTNYEFDPKSSRNSTAREIADDLSLHDISVDEDTVRKWLKESIEFLPRDKDV
ncbi:MAG: hypothetical protein GC137_09810 [Alphaproteobacteria bacterium]|nr:hypothetical protein [Alphaproteobacteria bacterium]